MKAAINCVTMLLWMATPAHGSSVAIGDSLAVGFGAASHIETHARVGASSCAIVGMVPSRHYDFALISAGTNDPPGRCIEQVRARVNADVVEWVVPVNGARGHVLQVAARHGDRTLSYAPAGGRAGVHPRAYWNVLR